MGMAHAGRLRAGSELWAVKRKMYTLKWQHSYPQPECDQVHHHHYPAHQSSWPVTQTIAWMNIHYMLMMSQTLCWTMRNHRNKTRTNSPVMIWSLSGWRWVMRNWLTCNIDNLRYDILCNFLRSWKEKNTPFKRWHILSIYYVPRIIRRALWTFTHLSLTRSMT